MSDKIFIKESGTNLYLGKYIVSEDGIVKPWRKRVLGWDPGKRMDSAGIAIMDFCLDDKYRLISVDEWINIDWPIQLRNLEHIVKLFEIDGFAFDANGPGNNCEDFMKELEMDGKPRYPYLYRVSLLPIYSHTLEFKKRVYTELKKLMSCYKVGFHRNTKLEDQFASLLMNNNGSITHKKGTKIDVTTAVMLCMAGFMNQKDRGINRVVLL